MSIPYPDFEYASCRDMGTDMFFTEDDGVYARSVYPNIDYVKKICDSCIVKDECLTWALHHELHGVWAGTKAQEREHIRIKRNIRYRELGL